uniref:TIL domain-containing protein n=1 Tax=Ciona savignyi TaxID=51511 RepID=H2Z4J9_CIOSA
MWLKVYLHIIMFTVVSHPLVTTCKYYQTTSAYTACPGNQIYSLCAGCDVTCSQRNDSLACPLMCQQKCTCPPDTYLHGDLCLTNDQCAVAESMECPGNQIFSMCGGCNVQCSDKDSPAPCPLICHVGCFCPANTYLHGDLCLTNEQCDVAEACPGNQIYSLCAGCDVTCSQRNDSIACPLICQQKCTCPPDTYLHGDLCLTNDQCAVAESKGCPGNQQYSTCHGCTVPCSDKDSPAPCPRICQTGCYCPVGTYLIGDYCVSYEQCPATGG